MTKTLVTAGPYKVGQALSYTLTIHNNGPSAAGPVQITDTPTNLTIRTISGACTVLPCTLTSLAAGATATINLTATINSIGPFNNVATATSPQTDPNTVNNADNSDNGGVTEGVIDIPFLSPLALLALLSLLLAMAWSYSNRAAGGRTFK